jgi:hypothetical protein
MIRVGGYLAIRRNDEVPEREHGHNPKQNRGDLILIYLNEVGALLDNLFIRLSAATVADRDESEEATSCFFWAGNVAG